ncbi:MAG: hypothetical protein ACXVHY_02335 [Methanobacterium sp.]
MVEKATIIVHSGDMDKLYSAFIIANGSLSMGRKHLCTLLSGVFKFF